MPAPARPRFLSEVPFPPYGFVPGRFPHPVRDPAGHSYGHDPGPAPPVVPERWGESRDYLLGLDLFNHGYYWEAHEAWERLWHAAGREGATAELLQGLIKLAAAGVKVREGRAAGTTALAAGARDLFARAAGRLPGRPSHLGLRFAELEGFTRQAEGLATDRPDEEPGARIVFPFILAPQPEAAT
jgi:hypothetical protein